MLWRLGFRDEVLKRWGLLLCHVFAAAGTHATELDAVIAWLFYLGYLDTALPVSAYIPARDVSMAYLCVMTAPFAILHACSTPSTLDSYLVGKVLWT